MKVIYLVVLAIMDLIVYIVLGLLMMGYDDTYDESKGAYWSWQSMNTHERLISSAFLIWNLINIIAIIFLIYRCIRWIRNPYRFDQKH
jgi:hypothetical protein